MAELKFAGAKLPPEIKFLRCQESAISEDELNILIQAAQHHVDGTTAEAERLFRGARSRSTCCHLAAVYGGLVTLLEAGRTVPPGRRRADTLSDILRNVRVPERWRPALLTAMLTWSARPAGPSTPQPVHWDLDVIIADSEGGRVFEPAVSLKVAHGSGDVACLQFSKSQFLRFRREMAVVQREMDAPHFRTRPS